MNVDKQTLFLSDSKSCRFLNSCGEGHRLGGGEGLGSTAVVTCEESSAAEGSKDGEGLGSTKVVDAPDFEGSEDADVLGSTEIVGGLESEGLAAKEGLASSEGPSKVGEGLKPLGFPKIPTTLDTPKGLCLGEELGEVGGLV